jgi:hypothetical protein
MIAKPVEDSLVMAGLVPAISLRKARYNPDRDHRVTALRAGPVMTS